MSYFRSLLTELSASTPSPSQVWDLVRYNSTVVIYIVAVTFILWPYASSRLAKKRVPAVGYPTWIPFGSYYGSLNFLFNSQAVLQRGYEQVSRSRAPVPLLADISQKNRSGIFKVPRLSGWTHVVAGEALAKEFFSLPEDTLSLLEGIHDEFQITYTMGQAIYENPYHYPIIRTRLQRNIDVLVENAFDELLSAVDTIIGSRRRDDWHEVPALETFQKILSRVFSRTFVGAPTCRNEDYLALNKSFSLNIFACTMIMNLFPRFMHPLIGGMISTLPTTLRKATQYLAPVIEGRKKMLAEHGRGDWDGKPVDFLTWLMDAAEGPEFETSALTNRVLLLNSVSFDTTSMTFVQALYNLTVHPEYIDPLRLEVEEAFSTYGLCKKAMDNLPRLDSFFKESLRVNPPFWMSVPRMALKPITFSDGTYIPKGSYISSTLASHHDNQVYEDAHVFDGFRFLDGSGTQAGGSARMVHTSTTYGSFGHGKHACVSDTQTATILD